MRLLVALLVMLAAAKVGALHFLYKTSSDDVIVTAYRPRALDACAAEGARLSPPVETAVWAKDPDVQLEIGRRNQGKGPALWQVDDTGWTARFRNPYLHVRARGAVLAYCEYDIVKGVAAARRG